MTYTPGPYTYRPSSNDDDCWEIMAPFAESPLAFVPYWPDEDGLASAEAEANARLFTAADELLAALEELVGFYQGVRQSQGIMYSRSETEGDLARARSAIAKARRPA